MTPKLKLPKDTSSADTKQKEQIADEDTPEEEENRVFQGWYKAWVERNDNSKR